VIVVAALKVRCNVCSRSGPSAKTGSPWSITKEVRDDAEAAGWVVLVDADSSTAVRDICPECAAAPQAAAEKHLADCWSWFHHIENDEDLPAGLTQDPASAPFDGCPKCEVRETLWAGLTPLLPVVGQPPADEAGDEGDVVARWIAARRRALPGGSRVGRLP
jgi:hypothetical protein